MAKRYPCPAGVCASIASAILSASDLRGPLGVVNWEIVNRTPVFTQVVATRRIPVFEAARRIVGLFQPGLSAEEAALTAVWLVNQPFIFVRNAEQMRHPPVSVTLGEGSPRPRSPVRCP